MTGPKKENLTVLPSSVSLSGMGQTGEGLRERFERIWKELEFSALACNFVSLWSVGGEGGERGEFMSANCIRERRGGAWLFLFIHYFLQLVRWKAKL